MRKRLFRVILTFLIVFSTAVLIKSQVKAQIISKSNQSFFYGISRQTIILDEKVNTLNSGLLTWPPPPWPTWPPPPWPTWTPPPWPTCPSPTSPTPTETPTETPTDPPTDPPTETPAPTSPPSDPPVTGGIGSTLLLGLAGSLSGIVSLTSFVLWKKKVE